MGWIAHKIRKPITGVFIGVFGVVEMFCPGLAGAVVSRPTTAIINFVLGEQAEVMIVVFATWKKKVEAK